MQFYDFRRVSLPPAILSGKTGAFRDDPVAIVLQITEMLWPGMESIVWNSKVTFPGFTLDVSTEAPTSVIYGLRQQFIKLRQGEKISETTMGAISTQVFVPPLRERDLLGLYGTVTPLMRRGEKPLTARSPLDRRAMRLLESLKDPFSLEFAFLFHTVDPPELDTFIEGLTNQINEIDALKADDAY